MEARLAASSVQSAAESEEELLRLQQQSQPPMHQASSSGAFSTASVDQFLRDNGFDLDAADDDVLSSSGANSDFGGGASAASPTAASGGLPSTVEGLLRAEAFTRRRDRDENPGADHEGGGDGDVLSSDDGSHLSGAHVGSTAAGEEGDFPPPRFILLDDEELLSMSHEPPLSPEDPAWRRPVSASIAAHMGSPLDRSMLLGGSGLSALSEESQSGLHHHHAPEPTLAYRRRLVPPTRHPQQTQRNDEPRPSGSARPSLIDRLVASSSSSSSSASYASSPRALSSSSSRDHVVSSKRTNDDELSDALGVGSSQPSSRSRPRLSPRRLSPHDEDEHKDATDSLAAAANPWPRTPPRQQPDAAASGDGGDTEREMQRTQWSDLNVLLRKNGLPALVLRELPSKAIAPDHASLMNLVQDLLLQLGQKNEAIQDLVIDSNRSHKEQSKAEGDVASLTKKSDDLKRSLQNAQNEVARLEREVQRQKDETERLTKSLKASVLKLQQQLKVSEHRVKAKEVLVERMQKKVQQHVDKETLNRARDRKVFQQLQQRVPRKTNAADNQALEWIGLYETQREQMQHEIDHLRSQVAALNGEVRDKENSLSRRSSLSQAGSMHWSESVSEGRHSTRLLDASDDMLQRLEAARRDQEQAAAKLRQREAIMVKKISAIEEELLGARDTISELKDENANLAMEAESRPSIRDYRLAQRRIHQLERQLSEQKLALEEANDIHELRKFMGTSELMERDRVNHRLHLNRLATLPKETLLEVVKEVCRVLNLTDITLITPSLQKLCNVVTAVPRMEQFIRDVCGFVYFNGDPDNQHETETRFELEQVLPTLQQWMVDRKKLYELEGFKASIVTELCKRSVEPSLLKQQDSTNSSGSQQPLLSSLPRAVRMVAELVELEKSVMHHKEIYTQAAEELERRPSVLVNQIVRHFSHVFDVKQVDGVLPRINEIYLFVNEMENFLKAIRSLLVLKPNASPVICIDAIRSLVEGERPRHSARDGGEAPEDDDDAPNYVVQKSTRGRVDAASGGVAGVRQVREMSVLIRDLKKELGAATMHEILPRTRRLMELLSLSIHQTQDQDDD